MCSHVCSVFYWLIGDALLMYCGAVSFEIAPTLLRCVLEFWCDWVGVVSV